jgi:predicted GTPase
MNGYQESNESVESIPNILLCGKKGIGKSSFIDFILDGQAEDIKDKTSYTKDAVLCSTNYLNFFDSSGYDDGTKNLYKQQMFDVLLPL